MRRATRRRFPSRGVSAKNASEPSSSNGQARSAPRALRLTRSQRKSLRLAVTVLRKNPPPGKDVQRREHDQACSSGYSGRLQRPAPLALGSEPHEGRERCGQDVGLAGIDGRDEKQGREKTLQRLSGQRATTKSPAQESARPNESTRESDDQRTTKGMAGKIRPPGHGRDPVPGQRVQRQPHKERDSTTLMSEIRRPYHERRPEQPHRMAPARA